MPFGSGPVANRVDRLRYRIEPCLGFGQPGVAPQRLTLFGVDQAKSGLWCVDGVVWGGLFVGPEAVAHLHKGLQNGDQLPLLERFRQKGVETRFVAGVALFLRHLSREGDEGQRRQSHRSFEMADGTRGGDAVAIGHS